MSCGVMPRNRGLGHAEKFIQVRGISGSDFQSSIDIGDPVRIAVHKNIDRDLFEIRQPADKAAAGPRRHASHADQDAVGLFPVVVFHQPLKHARGFDHEDEIWRWFRTGAVRRK